MADRAGVVPQLLGAAVGIVLGATLLFVLVGMLRDDEPSPEVVADPTPTATVDDPSEEPDPEPSDEPTDEVTEEPAPEPTEDPTEEPTEEPEPEPTETDAPSTEVEPAEVSIQVLNAVGGQAGAAAARATADELRGAGYDVVVINRAGTTYDTTTVFWTEGQEAGGRQVAAALGTSEVEQTPAEVRLSDSVDVHVVVGTDRT